MGDDDIIPAVAIVSGGLDSVTMLHQLIPHFGPVHVLTFLYGQKHNKEVSSAKYFVNKLGLKHHEIIDLNNLKPLFGSSALTSKKKVPHLKSIKDKKADVLKKTVVPFRNGIFLSIAVAYATARDISCIFYGAHGSDYATYPDTRQGFIHMFTQAAQLGTDADITIDAFTGKKSDVVKAGYVYGVEFEKTWSCYEGGSIHCGVCPSCFERKNAFKKAKLNDPTRYGK